MVEISRITSPWPIITALMQAEKMSGVGSNLIWSPKNRMQELFINRYFNPLREIAIAIPEIKSKVSRDVAEINAFLRENGYSIQLKETQPSEFAMASILDLLLKWIVKGAVKPIREHGTAKEYPGFRVEGKNATFYTASGHSHPIAALATQTSDVVMITIADRVPSDEFDLMSMIEEIEAGKQWLGAEYGGVHLPMVDLKAAVDISWILSLETICADGGPLWISQALMEAKARINEVGVRVQIAVAMATMRGMSHNMPKPDMVIDRPFLLWIVRKELPYPLAYAYFAQNDWKNPGNIEN